MLREIQQGMLQRALDFRHQYTSTPQSYEEFKAAVENGFALVNWCGDAACEAAIQDETKASNRCIPLDQGEQVANAVCVRCGSPAKEKAIFARAY